MGWAASRCCGASEALVHAGIPAALTRTHLLLCHLQQQQPACRGVQV